MNAIVMPHPAPTYITDGENLSAAVTNRPTQQIQTNLDIVHNVAEGSLNNYNATIFGDFINYSAGTTYKRNDIVNDSVTSIKYRSLVDNNLGNPLTSAANWAIYTDLPTQINVYKKNEIDAGTILLTSIKNVDGSGSGLDADLLDGKEGIHYENYAIDAAIAMSIALG